MTFIVREMLLKTPFNPSPSKPNRGDSEDTVKFSLTLHADITRGVVPMLGVL